MKSLIDNTIWALRQNFKFAPILTFAGFMTNLHGSTFSLLQTYIIGLIIDWVTIFSSNPDQTYLIWYSLAAFSTYYVLNAVLGAFGNYSDNLAGYRVGYVIPRLLIQDKLSKLKTMDLENPYLQNLLNRVEEHLTIVRHFMDRIFRLTNIITALTISLLSLVTLIPIPTVLLLILSIPAFFFSKFSIERLHKLSHDTTVMNRRGSAMIGMISDPKSLKEIQILNGFGYLLSYFRGYVDLYSKRIETIYRDWSVFDISNALIVNITILFGIYQLITLTAAGEISVGQIVFFITALITLNNQVDNLAANGSSFIGENLKVNEMRELLNSPEENAVNKKNLPILNNPPLIELNNVSFSYPESTKSVITDLNLSIQSGEKIAIVGENGAGKTTLVKLLSNIYPVTTGQILANGEELNNITQKSWFNNIGVLYQDYNTYDDLSVFENIALGRMPADKDEIDYDEIIAAAKKAGAHEFIMDYEDNYSQILSERYDRGIRPSTGQWQKIAIARFFYRNAPILILDEPTSAIDAVAEAEIFDRIYEFIENKTVIIISHRFSTVRNADRIIVMDKGKIIEQGSHEQLLQLNGKYANAFNVQAKGYV